MSGGTWNYAGMRIASDLLVVGNDPDSKNQWPLTAAAFQALSPILYLLEKKMDYDLAGDRSLPDTFDKTAFGLLLTEMLKLMPEEWTPVTSKWALIQHIQSVSGCEILLPDLKEVKPYV